MTSPVAELIRVPTTFRAADGTAVESPLIEAAVNGVHARFVVDTGSDVHLLTTETAERAGLTLRPGEQGPDHRHVDAELLRRRRRAQRRKLTMRSGRHLRRRRRSPATESAGP